MSSQPPSHAQHRSHGKPGAGEDAPAGGGEAAMALLLDLDAEVLQGYLPEVTGWVADVMGDQPCRRIVDVGAGTGTGTLALLERFAGADVTAVDVSAAMLDRLQDKARRSGLGDRVRAVQADLDGPWPALGPADLVWAATSMHHMADPDRALSEVSAALRPGGLIAVTEFQGLPRFLPDDVGIGRPGLEARCHAALAAARAEHLLHQGSDWAARLTAAGFTVQAQKVFTIDLSAPPPAATARYAHLCLHRMRTGLAERLTEEDTTTLDALLAHDRPDGVLQREDLTVRTIRTGWVASRP